MNWIEKATRRLKTQVAIAEVASVRLRQAGDYGNAEDWIRMSRELYNIINLLTAPIGQQGEPPEDDWDNEDYMRGWQDGKQDSVDPRSKTPCPGCARGDKPVLLDEDGTRCSVSGEPGRLGHGVDDRFWFCDDHFSPDQQGEPVGWWMVRNKSDGFVFFVRNDDETWGERARKPYPHDGFEYTAVVCQNLPNREREALELLARAVNYVRIIYSDHPDPSWAEEADHILSEGGEG